MAYIGLTKIYALVDMRDKSYTIHHTLEEAESYSGTMLRHLYAVERREIYCLFAVILQAYGEPANVKTVCTTYELASLERQKLLIENPDLEDDLEIKIYELKTA